MAPKATPWEVPDPLWEQMVLILDAKDPQKRKGRPRTDQRRVIDGILFKIRTGCQWNLIPKVYGSDTTLHRNLKRWSSLGVWQDLWAVLAKEFPQLATVEWKDVIPEGSNPTTPLPPSAPLAGEAD